MSLPHVLLGLLQAEPRTGYELARTMERELAYAWSAGFSQIYPALARLRRYGWVRLRTLGPRRGPPRLLYRLTAAGRRELARWLSTPEPPARPHDPVLARIAFLDALTPAERRRVAAETAEAIAAEIESGTAAPAPEGSLGLARRAAIAGREELRRILLSEGEPEIHLAGRRRRPAPQRRRSAPIRRRP